MKVVPIPCKAKQSFSPGFFWLSKGLVVEPIAKTLKNKFTGNGKVYTSLIVLTAPDVDKFLAILNNWKILLNI